MDLRDIGQHRGIILLVVGVALAGGVVLLANYLLGAGSPGTITLSTTPVVGRFENSARVSVIQASLVSGASGSTPTGTVTASNTGSANTSIEGAYLSYGGRTCSPGITYSAGGGLIQAGGSTTLMFTPGDCDVSSESGEQFSGTLSLSNGASVQFTGTFE